jgi:diaminopimelate epimerase
MCGNGVRCVAKFLKDKLKKSGNVFKIDTRAGVKQIELTKDNNYAVNMGKPVFFHSDFPDKPLELEGLLFNFVSVGNPHAVSFVNDLDIYNIGTIGPKIEHNSIFPNKINFHLVEKKKENEFEVLTWERGCGATLACGTGATAVFAILHKHKGAPNDLVINLPGGKLFMSEDAEGDIIMEGPAVSVFSSMIEIQN